MLAREVLWRARRNCASQLASRRYERPGLFTLRPVPYYRPDFGEISGQSRALIIDYAEEILAGGFPFLSYGTVDLGKRPKWNRDFVSGAEWPTARTVLRNCIRHDGSDVKAPYELSRLQFLPVLGKAYVLTGQDSYRRIAKRLLCHWIKSNPAPVGINWTVAMEAALRSMSICFLMNLLSPFRRGEEPWVEAVTRSLGQHLIFIEANLEFSHFLTSNHYLSDVVGLFCLSLFLDGKGMAKRRVEYKRRIETEMARQVYEDGGDYEGSTGYQVLVTQLFTTALLLMRAGSTAPPAPRFVERLKSMYRFLNSVSGDSGALPHLGDCDDGRTELLADDLQQMVQRPVAERDALRVPHLLGLGRRLFGEGKGGAADAAWYGLAGATRIPSAALRAIPSSAGETEVLPRSGIGILRHGAAELLLFAMPNGIHGKGSHTHNDKLSFVLRVGGQEILCDPGTGCYTRDMGVRNRFRSTAAHNTLMIDGTEQNRITPGPLGLFILGNEASVSRIQEGRDSGGCFLRASHMGYRSLQVTHTRTLRMVEGEQAFFIEDDLDGDGVHNFEFNLQLAPNRSAEVIAAENVITCRISGEHPIVLTVAGPARLHGATRPSLISPIYGVTVPAVKVRMWGSIALPARITTHLSWTEAAYSSRPAAVKEAGSRDAMTAEVCEA